MPPSLSLRAPVTRLLLAGGIALPLWLLWVEPALAAWIPASAAHSALALLCGLALAYALLRQNLQPGAAAVLPATDPANKLHDQDKAPQAPQDSIADAGHSSVALDHSASPWQSHSQDSEALYALAMRGTNEGLWDWNPITHELYLSTRLLSVLGVDSDHLRTHSDEWLARIHPEDRTLFQRTLIAHLAGQTPHFECEYRVIDQDREYRWVLARGLAQRDAYGVAFRMAGSIGDITERKRNEARLRSELEFKQTLIDSLPAALFAVRPNGNISLWNRRLLSMTGYAPEQIPRLDVLALVREQDRPIFLQRLETTFARGEASGQAHFLVANAAPLPCEYIGRKLRIEGEERVLFIATDISVRLAAEDAMRNLNQELEARVGRRTAELAAALRELESFSYSVSHDLRTPLRAIDGYCAILASDYVGQLDDNARRMMSRVRSAVQRMGEIIDDLLSLSRMSRRSLTRVPFSLSALAREVVEEIAQSPPERSVEFHIDADLAVFADPQLLRIVLENLLGNAWKFTARTAAARIRLQRTADVDGEATYCVSDNGAGFDMRYADKLFGAFQRLHSEQEFEGTGIGLATVSRIIQRHGGRAWATSAPGDGARFYFTLGKEAAATAPAIKTA